ncbi:MAG: cobalamin biosynthesis protein [Ruminococcus sp.]|nr:cobalamin biosynthesis protein [Ruminococcus sp.]
MIISTLAAMTAGYVLGLVLGVPRVISARRLLGLLCEWLAPTIKSRYQDSEEGKHTAGIVYLVLLLLMLLVPILAVLILLYIFFPFGAIVIDAVLCWSVMDIKGISTAAGIAARAVKVGNQPKAARYATLISGEDCSELEVDDSARGAVQGIADRTVDTIVGPLLCSFILSGAGAVMFAAADAAAGVADSRYGESDSFGDTARGMRDVLCFLPGKLAAVIMLVDALFLKLNTRNAERIMKSDSKKCARTAFGSCRAVLAGLLGISLLPEEVYSEQFMRTFTIGEQLKDPSESDIFTSRQLMLGTSFIVMLLLFMIKLAIGI